ncbi:MAG: hypothetical protein WCI77_05675 [Candidatus Omnitrophota bacterium]
MTPKKFTIAKLNVIELIIFLIFCNPAYSRNQSQEPVKANHPETSQPVAHQGTQTATPSLEQTIQPGINIARNIQSNDIPTKPWDTATLKPEQYQYFDGQRAQANKLFFERYDARQGGSIKYAMDDITQAQLNEKQGANFLNVVNLSVVQQTRLLQIHGSGLFAKNTDGEALPWTIDIESGKVTTNGGKDITREFIWFVGTNRDNPIVSLNGLTFEGVGTVEGYDTNLSGLTKYSPKPLLQEPTSPSPSDRKPAATSQKQTPAQVPTATAPQSQSPANLTPQTQVPASPNTNQGPALTTINPSPAAVATPPFELSKLSEETKQSIFSALNKGETEGKLSDGYTWKANPFFGNVVNFYQGSSLVAGSPTLTMPVEQIKKGIKGIEFATEKPSKSSSLSWYRDQNKPTHIFTFHYDPTERKEIRELPE